MGGRGFEMALQSTRAFSLTLVKADECAGERIIWRADLGATGQGRLARSTRTVICAAILLVFALSLAVSGGLGAAASSDTASRPATTAGGPHDLDSMAGRVAPGEWPQAERPWTASGSAGGLGVSRRSIQAAFEASDSGFHFQPVEGVSGQPRVRAASTGALPIVDLVGPAGNLRSAAIVISPSSSGEFRAVDLVYAAGLIHLAAPDWTEANGWFMNKLSIIVHNIAGDGRPDTQTAMLSEGNTQLVIQAGGSGSLIVVTIRDLDWASRVPLSEPRSQVDSPLQPLPQA
jgi:hypothetical protein